MNVFKTAVAVAAVFAATLTNAQEARYELKSAIIKCEMTTQGIKMTGTQYFDNYGQKEAALMVAETPMGKTEIKSLQFSDTTYSINMAQKIGQKVIAPEKPINYQNLTPETIEKYSIKELGEETIAGKPCKKYSVQMTQAGQTVNGEVSVWKGIVLKSTMSLGLVEILNQTAVEIQENVEIAPSTFEVPEGVVIM